jgi:excisionase family DNA binding protein
VRDAKLGPPPALSAWGRDPDNCPSGHAKEAAVVQEERELQQLLTGGDVARVLGVSRKTVYRLVESRDLPAVRVGGKLLRFRSGDVARYIKEHVW